MTGTEKFDSAETFPPPAVIEKFCSDLARPHTHHLRYLEDLKVRDTYILQLKGDKPFMFLFSHKKKPLEYLVILISLNKGLREEQTGGGGGDVEAGGGQRGGGHRLVQEGLEGGQTDQG